MMRSLWTAASGMIAQQFNIDTISNNLANVNTTAYKAERAEFKSLLYQMMQRADQDPANQTGRPVNLQFGLGVRPIASSRTFTMGNLEATNNPLDLAIDGNGFFVVSYGATEGDQSYTRDGTWKVALTDNGMMIVTSEGYPILSTEGEPMYIPLEVPMSSVNISEEGFISYTTSDGEQTQTDTQIAIVQFSNMQGLEAIGKNLFKQTSASGDPIAEVDGDVTIPSSLIQNYIEMSNVQVAQEMVNMIVSQRAYELNSKAITTSDEMLQTANNLKR